MSGWGTADLKEALPPTESVNTTSAQLQTPEAIDQTPQEHGWAPAQAYDYATYNKSNKELADAKAALPQGAVVGQSAPEEAEAVGGVTKGDWAGNAAVYEWNDEYGDVGPRFELLEQQLFGTGFHVKAGIDFERVTELTVIQEGAIRIEPVRKFEDAGLHPVLLETVKLCGYTVPTPIQQYCLPAIFKGHDVIACAQTGSGKTAAFLIPILSKLMGKAKKLAANRPNPATYDPMVHGVVRAEPLVLIVCPNRELATQIFDEARRFCYRTMFRPAVVYGGGPIAEQIIQLGKGADILIGTPGRLVDFINRPHLLTLQRLKYMVIDEADELMNSDWETELKQIMEGGDQETGNITYMMFSATFPKYARDLAKGHLAHDHVRIRVGRAGSSHGNIKQDIVFTVPAAKRQALFDLLMSAPPVRTIIFVNSKRTADEVDDFLFNRGMPCSSIHSDRTQKEREDSLRAFRSGKAPILVATGVSARGLDIFNVLHVINFDLPSVQYGGIEEYTHRIGRTGRIGNNGLATSFYSDRDSDIAETLVKTLLETHQRIPDFLEQYIPEGFTADGSKTGNVSQLKFDADSDEEEVGEGEVETSGAGWGAENIKGTSPAAPAVSGWGAPADKTVAPAAPAANGWGTENTTNTATATADGGWATPAITTAAHVAPPTSGWGAATPAQPSANTWGNHGAAAAGNSGCGASAGGW